MRRNRRTTGETSIRIGTRVHPNVRTMVRARISPERTALSSWLRQAVRAWCDQVLIVGARFEPPPPTLPPFVPSWDLSLVMPQTEYARLGLASAVAGFDSPRAGLRAAILAALARPA